MFGLFNFYFFFASSQFISVHFNSFRLFSIAYCNQLYIQSAAIFSGRLSARELPRLLDRTHKLFMANRNEVHWIKQTLRINLFLHSLCNIAWNREGVLPTQRPGLKRSITDGLSATSPGRILGRKVVNIKVTF